MLDVECFVEIVRQSRGISRTCTEDRKVDLTVRELERYDIKIASLQQTKCLGSNIYSVGSSVLLTAGSPAPAQGEPKKQWQIGGGAVLPFAS